jgi:glycosyltransferase involved in cell wall biosynthesis
MNGQTMHSTKRSLHVAVVSETYPPEVNGVAMSMARVVQGLVARRHLIDVIRPRQSDADAPADTVWLRSMLTASWPVPGYPKLRMGVPCKSSLLQRWRAERPDVVHIATEGPLGWSALRAARQLRLPVTSDFRTNFHAYTQHYRISGVPMGWIGWPMLAYLRHFHNAAGATTVPTAALQRQLAASRFERLHVVSRGVDIHLFSPARRSRALRLHWGVGPEDLVLICVGRLAAEKNLDVVVRTFDALRQVLPQTRLVWVGDGPLREALRARCPQAIFAGDRRGEDLAAHYASADMFVFPSLTETFGNVTTEALASGLAVVAYDMAAAGQLIRPGINGQLAEPGNEAQFTRLALQLAVDAERRQAMGQAAAQTAAALGWSHVVQRFEAMLHEVIEATHPAVLTASPASSRWQPS